MVEQADEQPVRFREVAHVAAVLIEDAVLPEHGIGEAEGVDDLEAVMLYCELLAVCYSMHSLIIHIVAEMLRKVANDPGHGRTQ